MHMTFLPSPKKQNACLHNLSIKFPGQNLAKYYRLTPSSIFFRVLLNHSLILRIRRDPKAFFLMKDKPLQYNHQRWAMKILGEPSKIKELRLSRCCLNKIGTKMKMRSLRSRLGTQEIPKDSILPLAIPNFLAKRKPTTKILSAISQSQFEE